MMARPTKALRPTPGITMALCDTDNGGAAYGERDVKKEN
jgi:hypothetical protein